MNSYTKEWCFWSPENSIVTPKKKIFIDTDILCYYYSCEFVFLFSSIVLLSVFINFLWEMLGCPSIILSFFLWRPIEVLGSKFMTYRSIGYSCFSCGTMTMRACGSTLSHMVLQCSTIDFINRLFSWNRERRSYPHTPPASIRPPFPGAPAWSEWPTVNPAREKIKNCQHYYQKTPHGAAGSSVRSSAASVNHLPCLFTGQLKSTKSVTSLPLKLGRWRF